RVRSTADALPHGAQLRNPRPTELAAQGPTLPVRIAVVGYLEHRDLALGQVHSGSQPQRQEKQQEERDLSRFTYRTSGTCRWFGAQRPLQDLSQRHRAAQPQLMRWRRHSCLPPRHSCRGLALAKTPTGVETSLDAARKSACATKKESSSSLGRDYGGRHCELVVLVPWRPDGLSDLEEVRVEVFYTQRLARGPESALRVVPVDGPAARLGRGGQGLAVHHPVGIVLRTVVPDSLGNRGWKRWALAKGDAQDTRHGRRNSVQGKHRVPLRGNAHALY